MTLLLFGWLCFYIAAYLFYLFRLVQLFGTSSGEHRHFAFLLLFSMLEPLVSAFEVRLFLQEPGPVSACISLLITMALLLLPLTGRVRQPLLFDIRRMLMLAHYARIFIYTMFGLPALYMYLQSLIDTEHASTSEAIAGMLMVLGGFGVVVSMIFPLITAHRLFQVLRSSPVPFSNPRP